MIYCLYLQNVRINLHKFVTLQLLHVIHITTQHEQRSNLSIYALLMYVQCSGVAVDVAEDDVTSYDHKLHTELSSIPREAQKSRPNC